MVVVVQGVSERVVFSSSKSGLSSLVNDGLQRDLMSLQVLVVLQRIVRVGNVVVGRTLVLAVARIIFGIGFHVLVQASKVLLREDAVVGHEVIPGGWLVIVQVREASRLGHRKVKREESVAVVDCIHLLAVQVLQNVVLDYWILGLSSVVGSRQFTSNAVAERKDVLITLVLEGVFVDIDESERVSKARVNDQILWLAGWVDASSEERLFNDLTGVNIAEDSDFLLVLVLLDLKHFPAEADINAALVALVQGDLVGVRELVNLLVGGVVLDTCTSRRSLVHLVHSQERLVVERVEVRTLTLVWELGGVADEVTCLVLPSRPVVLADAFLVVKSVDEDVLSLVALRELLKALDVFQLVVESSGQYESLVGEGLAVVQADLVVVSIDLGSVDTEFGLAPVVNLGLNTAGLHLERLHVVMQDWEVEAGLQVQVLWGDERDLQVVAVFVLLDELGQRGCVNAA